MALLDNLLKTRRERILFYVTMTVVVGSLLLTMFILPALNQWALVSTKLHRKENDLKKVNDLLRNEKKIEAEYEQIQSKVKIPDPQKRAEDSLLLQADQMAKEAGVHFNRMDPVYIRKIPKMPNYQAYTLQVVFDGNLVTVGKFLQGMQERGLYIDYFQVVPKSKAPHDPVLTATIRMGKVVSKEEEKK